MESFWAEKKYHSFVPGTKAVPAVRHIQLCHQTSSLQAEVLGGLFSRVSPQLEELCPLHCSPLNSQPCSSAPPRPQSSDPRSSRGRGWTCCPSGHPLPADPPGRVLAEEATSQRSSQNAVNPCFPGIPLIILRLAGNNVAQVT